MKKIVYLLLAALLCLSLAACNAPQAPEESQEASSEEKVNAPSLNLTAEDGEPADGFVWEHNYSEITITGYVGASNDIVIPNTINKKPVTKIAPGAFSKFTSMRSLKVPGNVKTAENAFQYCTSLESVSLEEGIENLSGAFIGCSALKTLRIPEGVTNLYNTFNYCSSLETLILPKSYKGSCNLISKLFNLKNISMSQECFDKTFSLATVKNTFSLVSEPTQKMLEKFENYQTVDQLIEFLSYTSTDICDIDGNDYLYTEDMYSDEPRCSYLASKKNVNNGQIEETYYYAALCINQDTYDYSWHVLKKVKLSQPSLIPYEYGSEYENDMISATIYGGKTLQVPIVKSPYSSGSY